MVSSDQLCALSRSCKIVDNKDERIFMYEPHARMGDVDAMERLLREVAIHRRVASALRLRRLQFVCKSSCSPAAAQRTAGWRRTAQSCRRAGVPDECWSTILTVKDAAGAVFGTGL